MSTANDIRQTFFQECDELLEALDDGLSEIDDGIADATFSIETVNAVFRAVHSIKGGAAAFGLDALVHFAHQFETVLDAMRSGQLQATEEGMKICHRAADHLNDLVAAGRENRELDAGSGPDIAARLAGLVAMPESAPAPTPPVSGEGGFGFAPLSLDLGAITQDSGQTTFVIAFRPHRALYASGNDTALILRELDEMGVLTVEVATVGLPDFDAIEAGEAYLSWTLRLVTEESEGAVRDVFEFVEGMCDLQIEAVVDAPAGAAIPLPAAPETPVAAPVGAPPAPPPAPAQSRDKPAEAEGPKATVRVNLDLVDRLINMVGELVINQAVLTQCVKDAGLLDRGDLSTSLAEFRNLARDIQESVMAIRAQSVKPLFQRMARIVREAAELSGKETEFVTEGEATEVDKTIIERLVDPLTHMIRNAVDHGLESPQDRLAAGKPATGRVTLSAAHRSGRVLIEVSDDGAGINRPKVFQIAVEKGLIPAESQLKDAEIDNLLFMPGFSTASQVSNLSGRGVGMDVVRSAIQKLGGRVSIQSQRGKGTTMSISLPLTLAVLDGMVVDVAGQTMVVPITAIVETLRPKPEDIHALGADNLVVSVRNKLVPVIDLGVVFGHRGAPASISDMVVLLVESDNHTSWALAVDQIFDQRQVVIKGLESNYGHVPGVAAATILGDGNIALIIDPEETAHRSGAAIDPGELALLDEV